MAAGEQRWLERLEEVLEEAALLPAGEQVRVLDVAVSRVQARQGDAVRRLGRDGTLEGSGCRSVGSWARLHLRRGPSAQRMVRRVEVLAELAGFAAAFAAGRITDEHVDTVARGVGWCGLEAVRAQQDTLLRLAEDASAVELGQALQALADLANPDRDAARVAELAGRLIRIGRVGDLVQVDALVEPALGEALQTAVEAGAALPAGVRRVDDGRSLAQRRADAFGEIVLAGIGDGRHHPAGTADGGTSGGGPADGDEGGRGRGEGGPGRRTGRLRAQVALTVSVDRLAGIAGAPPALLAHFGAVPTPTAHRLICDAALTRVVIDAATGLPLDVGRSSRLALRRQRRALAAVFRRCAFPGCAVPYRFTEIHHVAWWCRDHGATDLPLLVPYCWSHHHFVHEHGFTVHRRPDGTLQHRRPDRTPIPDPDQPLRDTLTQLKLDILGPDESLGPSWQPTSRPRESRPPPDSS